MILCWYLRTSRSKALLSPLRTRATSARSVSTSPIRALLLRRRTPRAPRYDRARGPEVHQFGANPRRVKHRAGPPVRRSRRGAAFPGRSGRQAQQRIRRLGFRFGEGSAALGQHVGEAGDRQRAAEQVALHLVAAALAQEGEVLFGL